MKGTRLVETNLPGVYSIRGPLERHPDLREKDRIHSQLAVAPELPRTRLPLQRERAEPISALRNSWTSPNWSGCAVQQAGVPFTYVDGVWRTPTITKGDAPAGKDGRWWLYSWVGLDGYAENELLQIGTAQIIDAAGNVTCWAWFEWLAVVAPNSPPYVSPTTIPGFSVQQGQAFYGTVEYLKDGSGKNVSGRITLRNNDTGKHVAYELAPPPNVSMLGGSAEWILENPGSSYPDFTLASFSTTKFSVCSVGPTNKRPGDGDVLNIREPGGKIMTRVDSDPNLDEFTVVYYNQ